MPFVVKAHADDHTLTVTTEAAKEAFAKAIDWHVVHKFTDVTISDGVKRYSIDSFSSVMALQEIANTIKSTAELKAAEGK
jgi:hypothetical protein